jgi:thymidylate synthase (FAD)
VRLPVLDLGYVELVEAFGTGRAGRSIGVEDYEVGIVEAARQSTQGSFRGWDEDAKLLKRLYGHNHTTPFEFAGLVIEVQAPIAVFREWQRHRTQSYNEMSARYAPLPDLYYLPGWENLNARGLAAERTRNKQEAGVAPYDPVGAAAWLDELNQFYKDAERLYQTALRCGVPKELARLSMPVGHYSRMRASGVLHNWLRFLELRLDPGAQWEIRQYASAVATIVEAKFPRVFRLFSERILKGEEAK